MDILDLFVVCSIVLEIDDSSNMVFMKFVVLVGQIFV